MHDSVTGEPDTAAYRVIAVLLLLYAQPLVRIAAMTTEQIQIAPTQILVLLGKEPAAVPQPFAQLVRDHLAARPNLRTANTGGSPWLFPGYRAGRHLHIQSIVDRLRAIGIDHPTRLQPPSHPTPRGTGRQGDR